jgi:hypothetical protein
MRPGASDPPPPLTPGQVAWLETLSAGERARFEALGPEDRARFLDPHTHGPNLDPCIDREQRQQLAPIALPEVIPPPESTYELLANLPGKPPEWVSMTAEALVQEFGTKQDRRLWAAFLHVSQAVWDGVMSVADVLDCYRQAMDPQARNRGAVFNHALRAKGWTWA